MTPIPVMAIMIGIPGSGKSTFCKFEFPSYARINLDELHTRNKENIAIEEAIRSWDNIVIDNTNPTREERAKYIERAHRAGYRVIGYFVQSVFKDCMARNDTRTGKAKLPYKAVASVSKKLELPSYEEGFEKLYFVSIENDGFKIDEWRTD